MKNQPRICVKQKKYKLEESLNSLTHHEYRFARHVLPKIIGKCNNTLNNYINILSDSNEEIPYSVGLKLEQFFGIEHGGMSTTKEMRYILKCFIMNGAIKELKKQWT